MRLIAITFLFLLIIFSSCSPKTDMVGLDKNTEEESIELSTKLQTGEAATEESTELSAESQTEETLTEKSTYNLDSTGEDLSQYTRLEKGKNISLEDLQTSLKKGECRTYLRVIENPDCTYSMLYSFPFTTHIKEEKEKKFNGRAVSFLIGTGMSDYLGTINVSSGDDYAYLIELFAKREYRKAENSDKQNVISNISNLNCYIENPDGTIDLFWLDSNLFVLHRTGDGLSGTDFSDISISCLTEEEYAHVHAIAASYLYQESSMNFRPFKYDIIESLEANPSLFLGIKMVKNGKEIILTDAEVDEIVGIVKEKESYYTEFKRTLYFAASDDDIDFENMTHIFVIEKSVADWDSEKYCDNFYVDDKGKMVRKLKNISSSFAGAGDAMFVCGNFMMASLYEFPITELLQKIEEKRDTEAAPAKTVNILFNQDIKDSEAKEVFCEYLNNVVEKGSAAAELKEVLYEGEKYLYISSTIKITDSAEDSIYYEDHYTLLKKDSDNWKVESDFGKQMDSDEYYAYSESVWNTILKYEFPEGQNISDDEIQTAAQKVKEFIAGSENKYVSVSEEDRKVCAEHADVFFDTEEQNRLMAKCYTYGGAKWNAENPAFLICVELDEEAKQFSEELFVKSGGGTRGYYLVFPGETAEEYTVKIAELNR